MSPRSLLRLAGVLALAVLMIVSAVDAAQASLRILWRYAVLSYDNPFTQLADELICESSPPSQAGAEAGQATRLAVRPSGHLVVDSVPVRFGSPALSSGITRSPPAA